MEDYNKVFKKIRKGDKDAFEKLFRNMYPALCGYANSMINYLLDAEEIVQDVFFNIWIKRKDIKIHTDIRSYIYTSIRNKCLVYLQHQKVKAQYVKFMKQNQNELSFDTESVMEKQEMEKIIDATLNSFPDNMRNIFVLSRYEGLKYQEIAKKLSISVKTVEANISKALKVFRRNLGEYVKIPS